MYQVTGNYTPKCASNGIKEHYRTRNEAVECIGAYWVFDWMKIVVLPDDEEILVQDEERRYNQNIEIEKQYKEFERVMLPEQAELTQELLNMKVICPYKGFKGVYKASKVDEVGKGSLRGH